MDCSENLTEHSNATEWTGFFCKKQHWSEAFWSCIILVSFVFGVPGGAAVLFNLFQKRRKGITFTPIDVFTSHLTVMDLLYVLSLLPDLVLVSFWNNIYSHIINFLLSFNLCGRPLFITCISLEMYLAVVHPVTYRARKSLTPRVLMAVGVWAVTAVYGIVFVTICNRIVDPLGPIIVFALTLPVIGFCDFSIFWTLKSSKPGGKDVQPQKKKALQIITNNFILTFTSYFPPIITVSVSMIVDLNRTTMYCAVMIPIIAITLLGNNASVMLRLYYLGKLDWLKCWKQK